MKEYEPKENECLNCGGDERTCDCRNAPDGRCGKCGTPLVSEMDGADADGNRGRWITYCPECDR